jgi:murein DD-endopeptidase MepM/ murein hydrolase activator NlpD
MPPLTSSPISRMQHIVGQHPRVALGAVALAMTSFAVTAFGVAPATRVAPPQRLIIEALEPADLGLQREALAAHASEWRQSTHTQAGDSVVSLLRRLGVQDPKALAFARNDALLRRLVEGRLGRRVRASVDAQGRLVTLTAALPSSDTAQAFTHFSRLNVRAVDGGFESKLEPVALERGTRIGSGTIRSSLFEATDAAQIPDAVAIQIAEIFSSDIDFHRELKRGDTFRVVYESLLADGEAVSWNEGSGRVLAVEFVNGRKKHEAVWFDAGQGRGEYYDFQGQSRRRAFLGSPLEFSRVTSGFAMRMHPIHRTWKQHLGVDYAAPTGTTVRTVGDGVVEVAGHQGSYGKVVIIKHSQQRQTVYAHLSRVDVKVGQSIQQGQTIGAVGSTGLSTAPHLHFEFRVGGTHHDPMVVARAAETIPLPTHARDAFGLHTQVQVQRLAVATQLADARGRGE